MRAVKDSYSLPRIEDTCDSLNGPVWFTALDLKSGCWKVEMDEASRPLTAFTLSLLRFYECDHMSSESSSHIPKVNRKMFGQITPHLVSHLSQ